MTSTEEQETELRSGLPTGAGGPIGKDLAGTWSLLDQEQAFQRALSEGKQPKAQQEKHEEKQSVKTTKGN